MSTEPNDPRVERIASGQIDPATLYGLLRVRVDVFVVEQECPYPELDGRDLEPGTVHLVSRREDGSVAACVRVLVEPDGTRRVSRVATAADARGRGLAGALIADAVATEGADHDLTLHAQAHLRDWYGRFGFTAAGEEFLEDGIPHIPMRRPRG